MSTALRTYYRGHRLAAMRDGQANTTRYYHFDHQGTTQCLTDSTGAVTDGCDSLVRLVKRLLAPASAASRLRTAARRAGAV